MWRVGIAGVALLSCCSRRRAEHANPCRPFIRWVSCENPAGGDSASRPWSESELGMCWGACWDLLATCRRLHSSTKLLRDLSCVGVAAVTAVDVLQKLLAAPHSRVPKQTLTRPVLGT